MIALARDSVWLFQVGYSKNPSTYTELRVRAGMRTRGTN